MEHSKGLRFKVVRDSWTEQGATHTVPKLESAITYGNGYDTKPKDVRQAKADAAYVNTLIEQDERRQESFQKLQKTDEDLLVNLGNLGGARLEQVELNPEYELMVQDFLDTFNNAVTQGVAPIRALYAMCQGFGITLGCALRADLPFDVAKALVQMITTTASAQEKMLRAITQSMPSN